MAGRGRHCDERDGITWDEQNHVTHVRAHNECMTVAEEGVFDAMQSLSLFASLLRQYG